MASDGVSVAVATANPEKLDTVAAVFGAAAKISSVPCDSGIRHGQPWGVQARPQQCV